MFKIWQPVVLDHAFEQVVLGIWQDFILLPLFTKRWTESFPIHSTWVFEHAVASGSAASNSCQPASDRIVAIQSLVWTGLRFTVDFVITSCILYTTHNLTWISQSETFSSVKNYITRHCSSLGTAVSVVAIVIFLVTR